MTPLIYAHFAKFSIIALTENKEILGYVVTGRDGENLFDTETFETPAEAITAGLKLMEV